MPTSIMSVPAANGPRWLRVGFGPGKPGHARDVKADAGGHQPGGTAPRGTGIKVRHIDGARRSSQQHVERPAAAHCPRREQRRLEHRRRTAANSAASAVAISTGQTAAGEPAGNPAGGDADSQQANPQSLRGRRRDAARGNRSPRPFAGVECRHRSTSLSTIPARYKRRRGQPQRREHRPRLQTCHG